MAEFPQIQAPSFKLSEEGKERLRKVDAARPYMHRAALTGLPAMAAANYMLPQIKHRGLAIGAIGAAGAGLGLLDRKIESLAEEHEELRPTLKNYSKGSTPGAPMAAKTASVSDRVRRNQDELAAAFPMTMAQRVELQKEALMLDPRSTGKGLATAFRTMKGPAPALVGAGVGAVGGALADGQDRGRGALTGALTGAALGGAATGLTHLYSREIGSGLSAANSAALKGIKGKATAAPVTAGDYWSNFRKGFSNPIPARPTAPAAAGAAQGAAAAEPAAAAAAPATRKRGGRRKAEAPAAAPQPVGSTAAPAQPMAPPAPAQTTAPVQGTPARVRRPRTPKQQAAPTPAPAPAPISDAAAEAQNAFAERYSSAPASSLRSKLYLMTSKEAGINTMHDAHRAIGGRPPYALLTMGGETSNDAVINQMLRALFANTDAMRKATEDQVLAAFPLSAPYSYGRHRAIGRTADDIKAEIALAYTPTQR